MVEYADIHKRLAEVMAAGKPFVLATLVKTTGSVPRDPGAKMIVFPDGTIEGTIGGGNFEKIVIGDCRAMFREADRCQLKHYRFEETGEHATGMHCGGTADVFLELYGRAKKLVIFGAGHIGRELSRLAVGLGMKLVVVDDRADLLDNLGVSAETILTDGLYEKNFPAIDENCYVVIVTHGHKNDLSVLAKVIKGKFAYVGMIGSKAKVARTFNTLKEMGLGQELLDRIHAPIGLDIGAEGPYEIALAIAAEIIKEIRKPSTGDSDRNRKSRMV